MTINDILNIRPSVPEREETCGSRKKTVKGFTGKNDARSHWASDLQDALRNEGLLTEWDYEHNCRGNGFSVDSYKHTDSCTVSLVFAFDGKSYTVCNFRLRYKVVGSTYSFWSGDHNTYDIKTVELATDPKWIEGSVDDDLSVIAANLSAKYSTVHTAARKHYNEVATKNDSLITALAECLSSLEDLPWDEHAIVCNEVLKQMHSDESEKSLCWLPTIKIQFDANYHG